MVLEELVITDIINHGNVALGVLGYFLMKDWKIARKQLACSVKASEKLEDIRQTLHRAIQE